MTMRPEPSPFPSIANIVAWLLNLATWLIARSLQLPEPLVYSTGIYVVAQVQAAETRAAKRLCPLRLMRQFRRLFR
ncbi:hypothetical protein OZ411_10235 [Bradyrhizobium sp. Arg237L]|uniref:hypothetical protein n=1 Tax=Bradyrhizobium sp. Arg237L TaxID=3003352 RepID=UPI00249E185A|nr:hypothetical protein [Bradyrhizobium sp. Arg237L]MDI4233189.1 hypothetical protein [Bradyrhizobium sp. Arg237L]